MTLLAHTSQSYPHSKSQTWSSSLVTFWKPFKSSPWLTLALTFFIITQPVVYVWHYLLPLTSPSPPSLEITYPLHSIILVLRSLSVHMCHLPQTIFPAFSSSLPPAPTGTPELSGDITSSVETSLCILGQRQLPSCIPQHPLEQWSHETVSLKEWTLWRTKRCTYSFLQHKGN